MSDEPEPQQWIVLECDDTRAPNCLVRSEQVKFADVNTLNWFEIHPNYWVCPECQIYEAEKAADE